MSFALVALRLERQVVPPILPDPDAPPVRSELVGPELSYSLAQVTKLWIAERGFSPPDDLVADRHRAYSGGARIMLAPAAAGFKFDFISTEN
jgi:hypothetical protein